MMTLTEAFVTHRTLELLFALPAICITSGELTFVMRAHVVDQIAGHPEADVALGAYVLSGQRKCRGNGGRDKRGKKSSGGRWIPR